MVRYGAFWVLRTNISGQHIAWLAVVSTLKPTVTVLATRGGIGVVTSSPARFTGEVNRIRKEMYYHSVSSASQLMVAQHGDRICIDFAPFHEWRKSNVPRERDETIQQEQDVPEALHPDLVDYLHWWMGKHAELQRIHA